MLIADVMIRRKRYGMFLYVLLVSSLILTIPSMLSAQMPSTHIRVARGIPYCTVQTPGQKKPQTLRFDFYEPAGESDTSRPLVITLFGGGFVVGSRDWADMRAWCTRFAESGWTAASIDYRLMPAQHFSAKNMIRTGYMAAQDVSAAVRFFKVNASKYHIDTNRIFLLGQSAGAVAIIHALYMDEDERPAETFAKPKLPPLHSTGFVENQSKEFSVAGAILLWGSIFDPKMIDKDEITPVCMIHGGKDKILDAKSGYAFSMPTLPYVYGSKSMAMRFQSLGISSYELHLLENESHAFYFKYLYMYQLDKQKFDECFRISYDFIRETGGQ